jgi:hypothetical protein
MKIKIDNFRGIEAAEISVAPVTLVAGRNGAGKTSVCQAVAAALAGEIIPIEDLTKAHAGRLVRGGAPVGTISATGDTWTADVVYPEATRSTTGNPPQVSAHAAGTVSIVDAPKKERAKILTEILRAEPDRHALAAALVGMPENLIERIWQTIQAQSWDAAYAHARETGTRTKGGWEAVTGERYGSQKAAAWVPAAWSPELTLATEAALVEVVTHEREWLEAAISESAVSTAEVARLKSDSAGAQDASARAESIKTQAATLEADKKAIRENMAKMPPATQTAFELCPNCRAPLSVINGKIFVAQTVDESVLAARREALDDCQKTIQMIDTKLTDLNREYSATRSALAIAQAAAKRLAEIAARPAHADTAKNVDDCRARVAAAEARLSAWRSNAQAKKFVSEIAGNQTICAALEPGGLRLAALQTALADINAGMMSLCEAARWRPVQIGADMSIVYGGTPYMLASESEQFRCRVAVQLVIARADGSEVVIIDRADILDAAGRNGLLKAILHMRSARPMAAIVGMTASAKTDVPDLSRVGGAAYWIDNGKAEVA